MSELILVRSDFGLVCKKKPGITEALMAAGKARISGGPKKTVGATLSNVFASAGRRNAEAMRASRLAHEAALKVPMGATSSAEQAEKARKVAREIYERTYRHPTPYRSPIVQEDGKKKVRDILPKHVRETIKDSRAEKAAGVATKGPLPREQWGDAIRQRKAEVKQLEAPRRNPLQIGESSGSGEKGLVRRTSNAVAERKTKVVDRVVAQNELTRSQGDIEALRRAGQAHNRDEAVRQHLDEAKQAAARRGKQAAAAGAGAGVLYAGAKLTPKIIAARQAAQAAKPAAQTATKSGIGRAALIGGAVGVPVGVGSAALANAIGNNQDRVKKQYDAGRVSMASAWGVNHGGVSKVVVQKACAPKKVLKPKGKPKGGKC